MCNLPGMMPGKACQKKKGKKEKPVLTQHLYPTLFCVISSEVCAAAVVADLPRVRGENETIVGLGLN